MNKFRRFSRNRKHLDHAIKRYKLNPSHKSWKRFQRALKNYTY